MISFRQVVALPPLSSLVCLPDADFLHDGHRF